ncbi:MAG TPA: VOC family protein [Cyclobacteriaceae bacterium]|nr:VOC family protein [Cyclobacteriaceae bacterium]
MATIKNKITPFLWFDNNLEEAVGFYTSVFKNSKVLNMSRCPEGSPMPKGTLMGATFELAGQQFQAINGGPHFKFTEAISLFVKCDTQQEIDELWEKLTADGGVKSRCGWLKDKFGLSWQIVPPILGELLGDKDQKKASRVMAAMMKMDKIEISKLKEAYEE